MRSGNPKIQCDFPCWVVRHRSGVVVVGPNRRVVIELGDRVDLIFRLDIAVFGDADVNPDPRFIDVGPIQTAPRDRFAGRPYSNGTGSRPSASIATVLVLGSLELANSRMRVADVANVVVPHPAAARQECLAVTLKIWAIGARKPHGGHDNPLIVRECRGAIWVNRHKGPSRRVRSSYYCPGILRKNYPKKSLVVGNRPQFRRNSPPMLAARSFGNTRRNRSSRAPWPQPPRPNR